MVRIRRCGALAAALLLIPCLTLGAQRPPLPASPAPWVFVPGAGVGPITAATTEADLVRLFGQEHVGRRPLPTADGGSRMGTVVLGTTPDALEILWRGDAFVAPERVTIGGGRTRWRSGDGVTIGTTVQELAKLNGREFRFLAFGWQRGGEVVSWEGGRLAGSYRLGSAITIRLGPDRPFEDLAEEERRRIVGEQIISSGSPSLARLGVRVWEIAVLFP